MSLSDGYERHTLQWLFSPAATPPRPAATYLGLSSSAVEQLLPPGSYQEPTAASYSRVAVDLVLQPQGAAGENFVANSALIAFPVADQDWGTLTHCLVFDALTGGTMIGTALIVDVNGVPASIDVMVGYSVLIAPLALKIACD